MIIEIITVMRKSLSPCLKRRSHSLMESITPAVGPPPENADYGAGDVKEQVVGAAPCTPWALVAHGDNTGTIQGQPSSPGAK